jgi:transposase InsO family protein
LLSFLLYSRSMVMGGHHHLEAQDGIAQYRLSVLELARDLGNVTEACRANGISRPTYYEWKRRFQAQGLAGLENLPSVHRTHPLTTPPDIVEKVMALSQEHPDWGCTKLSGKLKAEGVRVSSPTVQKILMQHGMRNRHQRLFILEQEAVYGGIQLTPEQAAAIEKANPCFRERHRETNCPGALLAQDTLFVGHLRGGKRVYLQAVVDTYGSYAFGLLHTGRPYESAAAVLEKRVLPFYRERGFAVRNIVTDSGKEYYGTAAFPYRSLLAVYHIGHPDIGAAPPIPNGFVEHFNSIVQREFFGKALQKRLYRSVEALQQDFDVWLSHYNHKRPHQGYRNMGKRPVDVLDAYWQGPSVHGVRA